MACIAQLLTQKDYTNLFKHSLLSKFFAFFLFFGMAAHAESTPKKQSDIKLEGQISQSNTESKESSQLNNKQLVLQDGIFDNTILKNLTDKEDLTELKEDSNTFEKIRKTEIKLPALRNDVLMANVKWNNEQSRIRQSLELKIKWDKWRNRVTKKIWKRFNTSLAGGDAFYLGPFLLKYGEAPAKDIPLGTKTYYSYQVTRDRRIINARIDRSSGNSQMDNLILRCLQSLNREGLPRFPEGSQRQKISVEASMEITKNGRFEYTNYDDIESVYLK